MERNKQARAARRARKLATRRPRISGAERYSRRPSPARRGER